MKWLAKQYLTFEKERTRPTRDLLTALPDLEPRDVVDVGCGPGNSTEVLAARFPHARVCAFDNSRDMIDAARLRLPRIPFEVADLVLWSMAPATFDFILANAVLQWVPDHATLLPALVGKLNPGGALAVQMPDNLNEPSHEIMREIASSGSWAEKLAAASGTRSALEPAAWYVDCLTAAGCRVDVWRTTYFHVMKDHGAIVDWFKGSGLRPFLEPLNVDERAQYVQRYTAALAKAYLPMADGRVLLPFPRLFIVAVRGP